MAEEANTSNATATVDAPETPAASTPSEPTRAQQREAAEAAIAGKGSEAVGEAYRAKPKAEPKPQPAAPEVEETPQEEAETTEAPEAPQLSDGERQILSRLQIDEEDLPANPERRAKFLATLAQRVKDQDALGGRLANLEQKLQGQQPQEQTENGQKAEPTNGADYWKPFTDALPEIVGDEKLAGDFGKNLRSAVDAQQQAYHQQMVEPLRQSIEQINSLLWTLHTDAGFAAAKPPEGVDLSNPVNRKKVLAEANAELQRRAAAEGFRLADFNMQHAIPVAVQNLYQKKINEARSQAEKERRAKAVKGSPDKGGQIPGKSALSDEEKQLAAARAALAGKGVRGVAAAYDGEVAA